MLLIFMAVAIVYIVYCHVHVQAAGGSWSYTQAPIAGNWSSLHGTASSRLSSTASDLAFEELYIPFVTKQLRLSVLIALFNIRESAGVAVVAAAAEHFIPCYSFP